MGDFRETFRRTIHKLAVTARSDGGKNVWIFLLCVLIAFIFWVLMSLDNEVQRDFDVPVELHDVPDSITVISDFPPSVSVSVRGKGSQLLQFMFSSSVPPLKFKYSEQPVDGNNIVVSRARLAAKLRDYFGNGVAINSFRPDSLRAVFTSQPGVRLPLVIDSDIVPDLQCTVSGHLTASVDSVTVYSATTVPASLKHVVTEPLVKSGLKDTTRYEVRVQPVAGMRIVPDVVTVTVPVEPLISKKRMIPVEILNKPEGVNVILFPARVEISYLVPMSVYNEEYPMKAYADYNDIRPGVSKIPLFLSTPGESMRNVSMSTESVEFVIERQ